MTVTRNNLRVGRMTMLLLIASAALGGAREAGEHAVRPATPHGAPTMQLSPPAHTNRLIDSTSPYLLQHAHNPVDWYPWGAEALTRARRENRPIFLSIGYSACHWCHVMERESFENEAIAGLLNRHFVAIKVDREERPDLDALYMTAVQMMTGSGGWPMSLFLTPDQQPFYGGTYFPPDDRWGRPGFSTLLKEIARAWAEEPERLRQQASGLTQHLQQSLARVTAGAEGELDAARVVSTARRALAEGYDATWGGFSPAPKFPNVAALSFLLRRARGGGDAEALAMAVGTLQRMARGGMFDQIGGGFHRYSVDNEWLVPHFEKMLYDNARLGGLYAEAYRQTGEVFFARVARQTFDYLLRDMRSAGGAFFSAEDADSEGGEGVFYTWTPAELVAAVGADDAALVTALYGVTLKGNFEGRTILNLHRPPAEVASDAGLSLVALWARVDPIRARLLAVRAQRVRPLRDDKVLTAWNGMAIAGLARAAVMLDEPRYRDAAIEAGNALWQELRRDGRLLRTSREGQAHTLGFLDDYAYLIDGCVSLYESTFDTLWVARAVALADRMVADFQDAAQGGFFYTSAAHERLLSREKPFFDGAIPSANAIAATALLRLHALTGAATYRDAAARTVRLMGAGLKAHPEGFLHLVEALERLQGESLEVVIAGPLDDPGTAALVAEVRRQALPLAAVVQFDPGQGAPAGLAAELTRGRGQVDGHAAAYVCRNHGCLPPVTTAAALSAALAGPAR